MTLSLTRRAAFALGLAMATLPLLSPMAAHAAEPTQMTPAQVQDLQASGQPLLVVFRADWCSTCAAQERAITAILADDPTLGEAVTIALIDWDQYGNDPFTTGLNIPRRSTLVRFNGNVEIGRLVAQTSRAQIEALLRS